MNRSHSGLVCLALAFLIAVIGVGVASGEPTPPTPSTTPAPEPVSTPRSPCKIAAYAVSRVVVGCSGTPGSCAEGSCKRASNGYESASPGFCASTNDTAGTYS